jgi:hypothetical protein
MMNKWIPIALVAVVIAVVGVVAFGGFDGYDRGNRTEVGEIVTTADGETLVVYEDDHRGGFFPFGFLIFPLFWILVIGAIFTFFRRSTWRGPGPPGGPTDAWLDDWHRRAHAEPAPRSSESGS